MPRPAKNTAPLGFQELAAFAREHNIDHRRAKRILGALDRELYGCVLLQVGRAVYVRADIMERLGAERTLGIPQLARVVHRHRRKARSRFANVEAKLADLERRLDELVQLVTAALPSPPAATGVHQAREVA